MIKNDKVYFTIYGQWQNRPYEDLYSIKSIVDNKDSYIVYFDDGNYMIKVNGPSKVFNLNNEIVVYKAKSVELIFNNNCIKYYIQSNLFNKKVIIEHLFDGKTNKYIETREYNKKTTALHIFSKTK